MSRYVEIAADPILPACSQGEDQSWEPFEKAELISGVEDAQEWAPLAVLGSPFYRGGAISPGVMRFHPALCNIKTRCLKTDWVDRKT